MNALTFISCLFSKVLWFATALDQHPLFSAFKAISSGQNSTTTSYGPIFTVSADADSGLNVLPNVKDPEAVPAQSICPGYTATNVRRTSAGLSADLNLAGPPCHAYGNDVANLSLTVEHQAGDRLSIRVEPRYTGPENETWFNLPEALVPRPTGPGVTTEARGQLEFSWSNTPTFSFTVTRKETKDVLFTTAGSVLVYEDQFIEFVSPLPDGYNLYGLGEVIHGFKLGNNLTRTLWATDVGDPIDGNIYGSHPVYLDTRYFAEDESGDLTYMANASDPSVTYTSFTHGVYLRNAHAQEILLRPSGITWRTLGGSIDLYFFGGPKAEDVTRSYQLSAVGLPAMQQYWTLGYHQCRWGYQNWSVVQEVVDNFAKFEIPLETIWSDIDYMNQYRDFDNDANRFDYSEGAKFLSRLHASHQHYVPIVDSAIYAPNPENASDAYPPYDRGMEANAFMLNPDGSVYYGEVWPGYTVFPDWIGAVLNGTGAIDWWTKEVALWHEKLDFDGIWIDMSEVSSFCVGSCGSGKLAQNPVHPWFLLGGEPGDLILSYPEGFNITNATEAVAASSAASIQAQPSAISSAGTSSSTSPYFRTVPTPGARNINWPPYAINHVNNDLAVHAVSPNATHHGGYLEYDFHNLFGHQILNATFRALQDVFPGKRPFIIGRGTFAGSGKYAGHWGGDNYALWAYMYFSIPQALSFSLFGIPMFGVDTCGFAGNSDYELCSRWMQLSAFFPFYRNHNTLGAISQEPYVWGATMEASKSAMRIRYALLPYMYTLFAMAHLNGTTVMRALAWEFPDEPWLANADRQFLLGNAVLVTPCLVQGATTVDGVFPGTGDGTTVWYDWYTLQAVQGVQRGENVTIEAPLGHIPIYLRGGTVVPTQQPALTTAASRNGTWGVLASLNAKGAAAGTLYLDDGESLEPEQRTWVRFQANKTSLVAIPSGDYLDTNPLGNVTILGLQAAPSRVFVDGVTLSTVHWTYDATSKYLFLSALENFFAAGAWRSSWAVTWS